MYLIDKPKNRVQKIQQKSFLELEFKERQHLQEWIAHNPEILGEELLIIQKEFSGFSDTNERLDLLALDKYGNIVVIENKLDDTGKNVTWQALKYVSYCSTLTKEQIKGIYQQYLSNENIIESAENKLSDFFNLEYDDIFINKTQRIILVAANFRKEVTSTILWLLNYKLNIKCFRATPYALNEQIFLSFEQIIPAKDIQDFMISMADKAQEDISTQDEVKTRYNLRIEFWNKLLPLLKGKTSIFQNVNPTKDHWLSSRGLGISGLSYTFVITKAYVSVSLEIANSNGIKNKEIFDELIKAKTDIESKFISGSINKFSGTFLWDRLNDKLKSRISYYIKDVNIFNKSDWDKILEFLSIGMIEFEQVIGVYIAKIKNNTKITNEI